MSTVTDMAVTDDALEVRDAARRLGVSERTIWRRIRAGRLPVERAGRRILVLVPARWAAREVPAAYGAAVRGVAPAEGVPWPFDGEAARSSADRLRSRRLAALAQLDRIARGVAPDRDGLTVTDYIRELRDPGAADRP